MVSEISAQGQGNRGGELAVRPKGIEQRERGVIGGGGIREDGWTGNIKQATPADFMDSIIRACCLCSSSLDPARLILGSKGAAKDSGARFHGA